MTTNIFALIIVLGILIFIHEFGHFIFARLFGVGVEKFSLGFGPRLFGRKVGITDYRVSAIPLGGYVKMVGEEPDAEIDPADIPISFTHKHVLKRILIVAAGPTFNFFLAVMIFFVLFQIYGIQKVKPVVRNIYANSAAQKAGFKDQDLIVSVNRLAILSWDDVDEIVESSKGKPLEIRIRRGEEEFSVNLVPEIRSGKNIFGEEIEHYDIGASGIPVLTPEVGDIVAGTPAAIAGLQIGDRITAINGTPVETWNDMKEIISSCKGNPLQVSIQRGQTPLSLTITPERTTEKKLSGEDVETYRIGISAPSITVPDAMFVQKLNPIQAFSESIIRTYDLSKLIAVGIVKMIQGKISLKELGGPIIIAKMAGDQAREGAENLIFFIAFLSINLAILNFLPIPVLDGGHLLFFTIELIRGRPVSIRVREIAQQGGMIILILLMIFAFYNDIMRVFF